MPTDDPRAVLAAIQARADETDRNVRGSYLVERGHWHEDEAQVPRDALALVAALGAVLDLADDPRLAAYGRAWVSTDDLRAVIAEHLGGAT